MKAIVYTYDKYLPLAYHMIKKYETLWPSNPFEFIIPHEYPLTNKYPGCEYKKLPPGTSFHIPTDLSIGPLYLLNDMEPDDWVFWSMDDKFLSEINLQAVKSIYDKITNDPCVGVDGILFCRCRHCLPGKNENIHSTSIPFVDNIKLIEKKNYQQIWIHQFIRVKALRHFFKLFNNQILDTPGAMDPIKDQFQKPKSHRLYVTEENHAVYIESAARGKLTKQCYDSLIKHNIEIPSHFSISQFNRSHCGNVMGHLDSSVKL